MKRTAHILSAILLSAITILSPAAADEVHVRQDASVTSYSVRGAVDRSFYPKNKYRYLYEGEIDFKKQTKDSTEFYGDFFYRTTDDPLIDKQIGFSVEKLYVGMRNENYDAVLGDFYASFSDYSLQNALKGGKLEITKKGKFKLISVGGIDTPKWEDLWENRNEDSTTMRYVWGQRMENYYFDDQLQVNFNYGGAWDDWATFSQAASPMSVQVGSVDWKAQIYKPVTLRGEAATSYSDTNARSSDVEAKADWALKLAVDYKDERYESTTEYSRVGQNFNTTGGFSARDLESFLYDGTAYLPQNITLIHYIHMDQNNLKKMISATTKQINPGVKLRFNLPYEWKAEGGYDMRKYYTTDTLSGELTNVYSMGLSRDFKFCYLTTQYSRTIVENYKQAEQDRAKDAVTLGLDGDLELAKVRFYWNVGTDMYLEQYSKIGECKQDWISSYSGGLKAVFPSTLMLEGKISFNDNDYYILDTDSNVNKYHFSVSRSLLKDRDLSWSFNYDQNEYYYTGGDGNYMEMVMTGKLMYKF